MINSASRLTIELLGVMMITLLASDAIPHCGGGWNTWYCHAWHRCRMYLCMYLCMYAPCVCSPIKILTVNRLNITGLRKLEMVIILTKWQQNIWGT